MSDEARALRILCVDDHPAFRAGVRAVLAAAPDLTLVGEASTGEEAVALAAELDPDLVVMDVRMPGIDGIEATRRIVAARPSTHVLVVTMSEDDATVFRALRAGAKGYVLKGASFSELLRAMRSVGSGEALFSPALAGRLVDWFAAVPVPVGPETFPELSSREREVLTLLASGRRNQEIAADLFLSPKTVRNLVSSILSKLQVTDRTQAMLRARDAGLA